MIDDAMTPLTEAHAAEVAEFAELVAARGERGSGRKQFEDRHKREVRRYRTDEIRAGLTELSRRYRDDLAASARPADVAASIDDIAELASNLVRNPNERLQLVALFSKLGRPRR
jgi:DNA polymerase-3 subunit delta'